MFTLHQLLELPEAELGTFDLAISNLTCAADFPDATGLDIRQCLRTLDLWAEFVRDFTDRLLPQFRRKPHEYNNSDAYFRALCLITVLQRDLYVRYNPAKVPADARFETADIFIHGTITGEGGTCVSLPVVYAAVGRRLGYPLKLVCARGDGTQHCFVRWDEPGGERFNMEATNRGLTCHPDDYYRTGLYAATTPEVEEMGGFLQSKTPREELSLFLVERGYRWLDFKDWRRALEAMAWAAALTPQHPICRGTLVRVCNQWYDELEGRKPPAFPEVRVCIPERRFPPTLPIHREADVLVLEATENILNDPALDHRWWQLLRAGLRPERLPAKAVATFTKEGNSRVQFSFT